MNGDDFGRFKDALRVESNYDKLFGTPERAALTLARNSGEHAVCNLPTWATSSCDYDAWLRWLRGDAE